MEVQARRNPREKVTGFSVDVTDGTRIFSDCVVTNVSLGGLAIDNLPSNAIKKACSSSSTVKKFTAIITRGGTRIKLDITPRWFKNTLNPYTTAGFATVSPKSSWVDFVTANTSLSVPAREKLDDDAWAGVKMKRYQ